ncbi:MAG: hypothetical protein R2710_31275 [Acidimicrobiales bacterium]
MAALFTALTFDLTVTTLFAPLLAGGRLVVIDADGPAAVRAIAERPDITWAKATPSHLDLLLRWLPDDHALRPRCRWWRRSPPDSLVGCGLGIPTSCCSTSTDRLKRWSAA